MLLSAESSPLFSLPDYACGSGAKIICFEAKKNNSPSPSMTNSGNPYAKVEGVSDKTLTISEEALGVTLPQAIPQNSTIILRNAKISNDNKSFYRADWLQGIEGLNDEKGGTLLPSHIVMKTPTSTIILESSPKDFEINPRDNGSVNLGDGMAIVEIEAKNLYIGNNNPSFDEEAVLNILTEGSKLKANVFVSKDGGLGVGNLHDNGIDSLKHFVLEGDLSIDQGILRIASMGGGKNPIFDVAGSVRLKDATLQTFISSQGLMENIRMVKGENGVTLEGNNRFQTQVSYFLQDFVPIDKNHIDYGFARQAPAEIYDFSLELEGNVLYAKPKISSQARSKNVEKLINDAKTEVALLFFIDTGNGYGLTKKTIDLCASVGGDGYGNCSPDGQKELAKKLGDYQISLDGLVEYLKEQKSKGSISEELLVKYKQELSEVEGLLKPTPQRLRRAVVESEYVAESRKVRAVGFENIDSKLSKIKDGLNNTLAETIKLSSNDLLAVNFVNTFLQPYNNTPIALLDEVKNNAIASNIDFLQKVQDNLGAKLSIAQRLSSYTFGQITDNQEDAINQDKNQVSPSSALWANLLGGATLNGSKAGGNFGLNVGYDTRLENTILGAYLSYQFVDSKDLSLQGTTHGAEAGFYLRSDLSSHQIDFVLKTLFASNKISKTTQALKSSTDAEILNSYTQASLSYGYNIISQNFEAKPYLGMNVGFSYTPSYQEKGDIPLHFDSQKDFSLGASFGVEFKKYFSQSSFFYITPSIEQTLLNTQKNLRILNLSQSQDLPFNQAMQTYAQILFGGEIALSSSWNIALSAGVKQTIIGSKDIEGKYKNQTMLIGNIGGVWKF